MTDTDKWKKPFLRGLDAPCKLLWFYICDDCDHAGIWHVDLQVAEIRTGEKLEEANTIKMLGEKIVVFDDGKKWFIPSFIEFQYPNGLNSGNKVHDSVIQILNKYDLIDDQNKPLLSPLQRAKYKDKDIDTDKAIGKSGTKVSFRNAAEIERQKCLKGKYENLQQEMNGKDDREVFKLIREFVNTEKPSFAEPFVDAWNIFAPNNNLSSVQDIGDERRDKIRIRTKEDTFDFFKILTVIRQDQFYTGEKGWKITFNYVIDSKKNYVPIIEKSKG